ncbi:hypothetical protein [Rhodoblastus sp.]|jgi:hypothetical protein|uniref:hypothetical protein n=1 Tax=Rhodoblastus sp. TaxID=1962975 RepID=UPI0025F6D88C|nr:hypothetical protein [Rhodoblastus sp.]
MTMNDLASLNINDLNSLRRERLSDLALATVGQRPALHKEISAIDTELERRQADFVARRDDMNRRMAAARAARAAAEGEAAQ